MDSEKYLTGPASKFPKPEKTGQLIVPEKHFDEENSKLFLILKEDVLDLSDLQTLADENGFEQKSEFHVTVVGIKTGRMIRRRVSDLPENERGRITNDMKRLVEETDFTLTFAPEKYHITKEYRFPDRNNPGAEAVERRESYIQMVTVPGMQSFYSQLNTLLGTNFEVPPAHVTLFTKGTDPEKSKMGIGVNTVEELLQMNPELIGN